MLTEAQMKELDRKSSNTERKKWAHAQFDTAETNRGSPQVCLFGLYFLGKNQPWMETITEAARLAKAHGGNINAPSAAKVFKHAECFNVIDEWIENELEEHPNMKGWPSTATAIPYNFRNNVPWDRVHQ